MEQHTPLGVRIVRNVASASREMGSQAELDDDHYVDGDGDGGGGGNGAGEKHWGRKGDGDWDEDTHRSRAVGTDPHITRYYDIAGAEERWHWCLRQRLWRAHLSPPASTSVWHQQRPLPECSAMRAYEYTSGTNGYSSQQLQQQLQSPRKSPLLANGFALKDRSSYKNCSLHTENASQQVGAVANSGECNRHMSRSLLMKSTSTSHSSRGLQIDDPIVEENSCCFERQCSSSALSDGCGADRTDITCCKHEEERAAALTFCDDETEWNALRSELDRFGEELSNARLQQSLPPSHDSHSYDYEAYACTQPKGDWERCSSPVRNGRRSPSDARQSLARSPSPTRSPPARSQSPSPSRHVRVRSPSPAGHFGCEPFGAEAEGCEGEWEKRVGRCWPRGPAGENDRFERYLTQALRELELFGDTVEFYKQWNAFSASDIPSRLTFPH